MRVEQWVESSAVMKAYWWASRMVMLWAVMMALSTAEMSDNPMVAHLDDSKVVPTDK